MKNIIDGKLKVCITGDNMENIQVRELEKSAVSILMKHTLLKKTEKYLSMENQFRLKQVIYQQYVVHGLKVTAMDQSIRQLLFLVQISWLFR